MKHKYFKFNYVWLFIFSFFTRTFSVIPKKPLPSPKLQSFISTVFSKNLKFLALTFRCAIHFEAIFVNDVIRTVSNFIFLYMDIQFPSTICWKDYSFPIKQSWHSCWKSTDHKCNKRLFLNFQCDSTALCLSLYQYHTVLITALM